MYETEPAEVSSVERPGRIKFIVTDSAGDPVENARVYLDAGSHIAELGSTDAHGVLDVLAPGSSGNWCVFAKGYLTERIDRGSSDSAEVFVRLSTANSVRGVVTLPDGATPCGGVKIVAFRPSTRPVRTRLGHAEKLSAGVDTAVSDHSGEFVLQGMEAGLYRFEGGGNGFSVESRILRTEELAGQPVHLIAMRTYGRKLRFLSPDGGAVLTNPRIYAMAGLGLELPEQSTWIPPNSFSAELLGASGEYGHHEYSILLSSYSAADSLGPLEYSIEVPGYAKHRGSTELPAVLATVEVEEVRLMPVASAWGSLVLRFDTIPTDDVHLNGAIGSLEFRSAESSLLLFAYSVRELASRDHLIDGIPAGGYFVQFVAAGTNWDYPEADRASFVEIGALNARFSIDTSETGQLHGRVSFSNGDPYTGHCTLRLSRQNDDPSRLPSDSWVSFEKAPYIVSWVDPGDYSITLEQPRSKASFPEIRSVIVEEGKATAFSISLD